MQSERWAELARLARTHYGLVTRDQALAILTRGQLDRCIKVGYLEPMAKGVWRVAGTPRIWRQRALAACLSIGPPVVVSHVSAALLWGFEDIARTDTIHLTVPPGRSGRLRPACVHHAALPAADITTREHIPVTTVTRTLADLAGVVSTEVLSKVTDEAMRKGVLRTEDLERLRATRARAVKQLVSRRLETPAGESVWEDRVYEWIVAAGLPAPLRQHQVRVRDRVYSLDMAYPGPRVGIEFDGFEYHKGRGRFDRDRERQSELAAVGWRLVVVTSAHAREEVVDRIRRPLKRGSDGPLNEQWRPPKGAPRSETDD